VSITKDVFRPALLGFLDWLWRAADKMSPTTRVYFRAIIAKADLQTCLEKPSSYRFVCQTMQASC
jgi:hypothetical protein